MSFHNRSLGEKTNHNSTISFFQGKFLKLTIALLFVFHLFFSSFSLIKTPLGSSIAVADTANMCLADAVTFGSDFNCTSERVKITSPEVTIIEPCEYPGDTATIQLVTDFDASAKSYDIGIWMGIKSDGTATQPGSCLVANLGLPSLQGIVADFDADACGDIDQGITSDVNVGVFTVQCIDTDGNGQLDLDYIITRDKDQNTTCNIASQALPGTTSHCNYQAGIDIPVPVPPSAADLSLVKDAPTMAFSGDLISYTLTLYNNGPSASTGTITDILPAGFTYVSSSPEATVSDGTLTYSAYLMSGESTTLTINGTVVGASGVVITNTATVVSSITDSNLDNNTDDATTTITATYVPPVVVVTPPTANLTITKTVDKSTAYALDNLTYTITYINNGPDTAYDVFIADVIPAGVTIISAPGYTGTGFFIGTLSSGSGSSIVVQVMINDGVVGSIINTASITSTTAGNHPSASATTVVSTKTSSFVGGGSYTPGSYGDTNATTTSSSNPTVSVIEEEPNIIEAPLYEATIQNKKILTPYKKLPKKMTKSGATDYISDGDIVIIEEDLSF